MNCRLNIHPYIPPHRLRKPYRVRVSGLGKIARVWTYSTARAQLQAALAFIRCGYAVKIN